MILQEVNLYNKEQIDKIQLNIIAGRKILLNTITFTTL